MDGDKIWQIWQEFRHQTWDLDYSAYIESMLRVVCIDNGQPQIDLENANPLGQVDIVYWLTCPPILQ